MATTKTTTPRLPTLADFPPSLTLTITPPPNNQPALNILLLLHGLGDTEAPFTTLAKNLNLPYTACITLRGPSPIPPLFSDGNDVESFHWGDDILFDQATGELDLDSGFVKAGKIVGELVVQQVLLGKCGFLARDVVFWGFGQGGMVALSVAASLSSTTSKDEEKEFGGVIAIGARLPSSSSSSSSSSSKAKTPILLLGGSRSRQVTRNAIEDVRRRFVDVEYVKWSKGEDSMPRNREEMVPVMRFFARRLRSRMGVPEGAVEIGR